MFSKTSEDPLSKTKDDHKLTFVFDIDYVLADTTPISNKQKLFYIERGFFIIAKNVTHYVFPGVIELMQYLFSLKNVEVAFFTSSLYKERDEQFVAILLKKALGEAQYAHLAKPMILSDSDLYRQSASCDGWLDRWQRTNYDIQTYSSPKKDLLKICSDNESLKNIVLIDSCPHTVYFGQEKNFIYSPYVLSTFFGVQNNINALMFRRVNNIYYLTGILSECIEKRESDSINEVLFNIHFQPKGKESFTFLQPESYPKAINQKYYDKGLLMLQTFNPNLKFFTRELFEDTIKAAQLNNKNKHKKTCDQMVKHESIFDDLNLF
jgi:hypothetical protein